MKKIKNKKLERFLATIVEFIEFTIISLIAYYVFKIDFLKIVIILLTFFISRFSIGKAGHYKIVNYFDNGWKSCFFWTSLLILSLCLVSELGVLISMLFTIFTAFVISGRANIDDISLGWKSKNEKSKYYDIEEFIKYNEMNPNLLDFEDNLKRKDNVLFLIYKYKFKDKLTFKEISFKINMDNPRIVENLDKIALAFRINLGI